MLSDKIKICYISNIKVTKSERFALFWDTRYNLVSQTSCRYFDVPVHVWICPEAWTWDWDKISNRMRRLHYCFGVFCEKLKRFHPATFPSTYKAKITIITVYQLTRVYIKLIVTTPPPPPPAHPEGGGGDFTVIWELTRLWGSKVGSEHILQFY